MPHPPATPSRCLPWRTMSPHATETMKREAIRRPEGGASPCRRAECGPQPTGEKNSRRVNPVTRQWRRFKETKFYEIWNKRPKFSYGAYTVVFIAMGHSGDHVPVVEHQHETQIRPGSELNFLQQVTGDAYHYLSSASCYLNMIALVLIYLLLVTLGEQDSGWAPRCSAHSSWCSRWPRKSRSRCAANRSSPSDLGFLSGGGGGGAGDVASFVTDDSRPLAIRP